MRISYWSSDVCSSDLADEAFDDDAPGPHPAALLRIAPGGGDVVGAVDDRLALARRRHDRLHHAGIADAVVDGLAQPGLGIDEAVGRYGQPQRFGGQPADALAVPGELRGAGRGRDARGARSEEEPSERQSLIRIS